MNSNDFNTFRRWFNQQFSLSFDGKFKGLSYLFNCSKHLFELFAHKLRKMLSLRSRNRHCTPLRDVIRFNLSGHKVSLYAR